MVSQGHLGQVPRDTVVPSTQLENFPGVGVTIDDRYTDRAGRRERRVEFTEARV